MPRGIPAAAVHALLTVTAASLCPLAAAGVLEPRVFVRPAAAAAAPAPNGAPRHVVVELGSNRGDWMSPYLRANPGAVPVMVEPLPKFERNLRFLAASHAGGAYYGRVAWSSDGVVMPFFEADAGDDSVASSMSREHAETYLGAVGASDGGRGGLTALNVTSVDVVALLARHTAPSDRVVLRMDIEGAEYEVLRRLITSGAACSLDELHVETHARYAEGLHRFYLLDLVLDWLLQGCAAAGGGRAPRVFVSPMRLGLPPDSRRLVSPHVPGCAACPWVQEAAWGFTPRA